MNPETLLIRADAGRQMGTGHVMRCLALAQAWQQARGRTLFALARPASPMRERLESVGCEVAELLGAPGSADDASETAALAAKHQAAWVVADGYHFETGYQRQIKEAGLRLLVLDDYGHAQHYCADCVLNQNLGASASLYGSREAATRLLLGPRYVLLRQEFLKWRGAQRQVPGTARRILVTLGGSDPENLTLRIVEGLARLEDCAVTVVAGGNNPHWESLQAAARSQGPRVRLLRNATNMPELMAEADLAISAGGTTVWELAFMGLPALLVMLADNQRANIQELEAAGIARKLGPVESLAGQGIAEAADALLKDAAARDEMSRKGRALIDGEGSFRVWLRLREPFIQLRRATDADCRLIWEWANDPGARKVSFSAEPIPWENHVRWFAGKLREAGAHVWIACEHGGQPIGQVRFDDREGKTVISINLGPEHRSRNLGPLVIWVACRKLFRDRGASTIQALIKPDNPASVRAFGKAGFRQVGATVVNHQPALVFELSGDRAEP